MPLTRRQLETSGLLSLNGPAGLKGNRFEYSGQNRSISHALLSPVELMLMATRFPSGEGTGTSKDSKTDRQSTRAFPVISTCRREACFGRLLET